MTVINNKNLNTSVIKNDTKTKIDWKLLLSKLPASENKKDKFQWKYVLPNTLENIHRNRRYNIKDVIRYLRGSLRNRINWFPRELTHWGLKRRRRQKKQFFQNRNLFFVKRRRGPKPWFWKPWKTGFFWRKRNRTWRRQNLNRSWVFYMRLRNSLNNKRRSNFQFFIEDEERVRFRLKYLFKFNLKFRKSLKQIYGNWRQKEFKKLLLKKRNTPVQVLHLQLRRLLITPAFQFARRLKTAEQMIRWGFICVNGTKITDPKYFVNIGDIISFNWDWAEYSKNLFGYDIDFSVWYGYLSMSMDNPHRFLYSILDKGFVNVPKIPYNKTTRSYIYNAPRNRIFSVLNIKYADSRILPKVNYYYRLNR